MDPPTDHILDDLRALAVNATLNTGIGDVQALHIRAAALVAQLKAVLRAANADARLHRQSATDARVQMDHAHLGLQNLLYEKRHLEREIEKCRLFASIFQDVPLYTLTQFQAIAPPAARTDHGEHQLMLNRLSFELAERQRLDSLKKSLAQKKDDLLKLTSANSATLDSIKLQIDTLIKSAAEIQKKVDQLALPASTDP